MLVRFLTLNVQGFRDLDKQREVMHYARAQHVDLLFLQECNFRTPRDVLLFRERFCAQAFFYPVRYTLRKKGVPVTLFGGYLLATDLTLHRPPFAESRYSY